MIVTIRRLLLVAAVALLLAGPVFSLGRPESPAAAATGSGARAANDSATRVVDLVNAERAKVGLGALTANGPLTLAAQSYSALLVSVSGTCFSHECGPVPDYRDRAVAAGYTGWINIGENIAAGQSTPEAVMASWMGSDGHRGNILNPAFKDIGVGVSTGGQYSTYWVQVFGTQTAQEAKWRVLIPFVGRST